MKISGFEGIIAINSFLYTQAINMHEKCIFSVCVQEEDISTFLGLVGQDCSIEQDDNFYDSFKFSGIIDSVTFSGFIEKNQLTVVVLGKTVKFDEDVHYRIFQNPEKKISEILNCMELDSVSCNLENERQINDLIVQDKESDWDFLNRIRNYYKFTIFPGEQIWIGGPKKDNYSLKRDDAVFIEFCSNRNGDSLWYRGKTALDFGSTVSYEDKNYFVDEVKYQLINNGYLKFYHLVEIIEARNYVSQPCYRLIAKITDNNDSEKKGRVKVDFENSDDADSIKDVMKDSGIWLETNSTYASKNLGFAFVPLIEDKVVVEIQNGIGRIVSLLRDGAFDEHYEDPNHRYLFLPNDTYIDVGDECVIFDNTKVKCVISKKSVEFSFAENVKCLIEDSHISLHTKKAKFDMAEEININANKFGVDKVNEINMKASSKVNIKGISGVSIN